MDTFGVTVSLSDVVDTAGMVFGDHAANDVIKNFTNITGSTLGDVLTGNKFANILDGGNGNDTLIGKGGADTLLGDDGTDIASYQGSALGVTVTLGKDGAQSIGKGGDAAGDKLMQIEGLTGSAGNDVLTGNNVDNNLDGKEGDDIIEGGVGADVLDGGNTGETIGDTVTYANSSDAVTINLGANTAFGGDADGDGNANFENVTGSNFDDALTGTSPGDNILKGGGGNDRLRGFMGSDTLDGGAGTADHADYSDDNAGIIVILGANGAQTLGIGGMAAGDKILNIENVTGGLQGDVLTGNALKNVIDGGAGLDVINGGAGDDTLIGGTESGTGDIVTYAGTSGAVTVSLAIITAQNTGGAGTDTISGFENLIGGNGADFLTGDNGVNIILGGTGNDTIEGGGSGDTLDGGANLAGGDTVSYANGAIFGATVNLSIQDGVTTQSSDGEANNDLLTGFENILGSSFGDILTGDKNANIISGGGGNDLIEGGLGADTLDGGAGSDIVSYANSASNVTITLGKDGAQTTVTGPGNSDGFGDKIKNFENVIGSDFNDKLTGNTLDNDLTGLMGPDNLTGGLGSDSFVYNAAAEGSDTITDFVSGTDDIAIDAAGFGGNLAAGPLAANYFVSGAGVTATESGHGQFLFNTTTNQLFWDDDGDGANAQVLIATFTNAPALTANDFDLF
jgi:Ca2+-binding RTX toxin-like protein